MAGRGRYSSLGLTTHPGSDLKLQRRSWRVNASLAITLAGDFSCCGRTSSPGYCTCRGPLSWRAVKAGECSYWLGKLIFAGVINRILLLTLAGEFSNLYCNWEGLPVTKIDIKFFTFSYEKVKNHYRYFFVLKSDKSSVADPNYLCSDPDSTYRSGSLVKKLINFK